MRLSYRKEEGGIYSWMDNELIRTTFCLHWYVIASFLLYHLDGEYPRSSNSRFSTIIYGGVAIVLALPG